jgi:DNA-directed RNA polymerase specialized sigma24 family protein
MADPAAPHTTYDSEAEQRRWHTAITAGPGSTPWDDLLDDLVTFALRQLRHEVHTGSITRWCERRFHQPMAALPHDWARQDREDIVNDTITAALEQLIRDIDAGHAWDPARGTSVASYFLDLCTGCFPNCLQAWRTRHRQAIHDDPDIHLPGPATADPERTAIAKIELATIMCAYGIPLKQLQALIGQSFGLSYADLAEQLRTSPQAVEGLIYRARQRIPKAEGGHS